MAPKSYVHRLLIVAAASVLAVAAAGCAGSAGTGEGKDHGRRRKEQAREEVVYPEIYCRG